MGPLLQLATDVDVYNDKRRPGTPIQIPLDFTLDVEELQQADRHFGKRLPHSRRVGIDE